MMINKNVKRVFTAVLAAGMFLGSVPAYAESETGLLFHCPRGSPDTRRVLATEDHRILTLLDLAGTLRFSGLLFPVYN